MVDEIYGDQYFAFQSTEITSQAKYCWMACIETGQREILSMFPYNSNKLFKIEKLHVLYRSSHFISEFSNSFLDQKVLSYEPASMIPGCFTSTQNQLIIKRYESLNDNLLTKTDSKFAKDRLFIVFTNRQDPENSWQSVLQKREDFQKKNFCLQTSNEMELRSLKFTGCEYNSVLVIIDLDEIVPLNYMAIHLAITRAQFEVEVYIRADLELPHFLKPDKLSATKVYEQIVRNITDNLSEKMNELPTSGVLKLRNYLQFGDLGMLEERLDKFPPDVTLRILLLLGSKISTKMDTTKIMSTLLAKGSRKRKKKSPESGKPSKTGN